MKKKFSEQFSLRDLSNHAVSSITSDYLFDREHGSGFNRMKISKARLNGDKLFIHFITDPTYERVVTDISLEGKEKPARNYDTIFEFQAVLDHIGDPKTFLSFSKAERISLVRDYIDKGLARVYCSCPAFYYQSHWEEMNKHGSSVFPFPGPRGTGIWKARHSQGLTQSGISICKHIGAVINQIDKYIPSIANQIVWGMRWRRVTNVIRPTPAEAVAPEEEKPEVPEEEVVVVGTEEEERNL